MARRGVGEGAAFEPAEVEREAVTHPGQNLELVAAVIPKDEQVAGEWIALQDRPHHAGERVDSLAPLYGPYGDQDAA